MARKKVVVAVEPIEEVVESTDVVELVEEIVEKAVEVVEELTYPEKFYLDRKYKFENADNDIIASIESFDPLKVLVHSVRNGCQAEDELSIESLDEYTITPLSREEEIARLSDAGNY